jgi:lactoylglutathione lyase
MFINHVAVYTNDLERLKDFYVKYFSGSANMKYRNSKTGLETYFISFDGNTRLEIMQKPGLGANALRPDEAGFAHLAFSTGSRGKVDELTEKLTSDGYKLHSAPRITGDGCYESSILDPDGNIVEITE